MACLPHGESGLRDGGKIVGSAGQGEEIGTYLLRMRAHVCGLLCRSDRFKLLQRVQHRVRELHISEIHIMLHSLAVVEVRTIKKTKLHQ